MKRRWAWTLTILAAVLAVVWVGSMRIYPSYSSRHASVAFHRGGVGVFLAGNMPGYHDGFKLYDGDHRIALWWFSFEHQTMVTGNDHTQLHAPLWPFVLLTGVPGVWMLVKTRRHTNPHACPACGYDRTGLPQTPTGPAPCPECGKGKDENR